MNSPFLSGHGFTHVTIPKRPPKRIAREKKPKNNQGPFLHCSWFYDNLPGIPTTIKTMGFNITTIVYLRVLIIQIGSTIILMVVEAQGSLIMVLLYIIIPT